MGLEQYGLNGGGGGGGHCSVKSFGKVQFLHLVCGVGEERGLTEKRE